MSTENETSESNDMNALIRRGRPSIDLRARLFPSAEPGTEPDAKPDVEETA